MNARRLAGLGLFGLALWACGGGAEDQSVPPTGPDASADDSAFDSPASDSVAPDAVADGTIGGDADTVGDTNRTDTVGDTNVVDAAADVPADAPVTGASCAALGLTGVSQSPLCWAHPRPFGSSLRAIVDHLGRYWISTDGGLFESTDGARWINRAPAVGLYNEVRADGGLLVVPSERGVFTSSDGATWQRTATEVFDGIEKRGSTWIGWHFQSGLSSSTNGQVWTVRVPGTQFFATAAVHAKGLWVVAGAESSGQAAFRTSPDGVNWTPRVLVETLRMPFSRLATNGTIFVATAADTRNDRRVVYTSNDGVTWTSRTPFHRSTVTALRWTGARFVAATSGDGIFTSGDGLTWTPVAGSRNFDVLEPSSRGWLGVERTTFDLISSPDGGRASATWTSLRRSLVPFTNVGVGTFGYGDGRFVALIDRVPATSTDGLNWSSPAGAAPTFFARPVFGPGRWVAVGSNALLTSADGSAWTAVTGGPRSPEAVAHGNGTWVATDGSNGIWRSPDGLAWTQVPRPGLTGTLSNGTLLFANGLFLRARDTLATSVDGTQWVERAAADASIVSVAWGAGRFVAVPRCVESGAQPPARTSVDGLTWTPLATTPALCGDQIAYGPGGFAVLVTGSIAPFRDSLLRLSADGISWTRTVPIGTPYGYAIHPGAGRWVVGAAFGAILASPGAI